MRCGLAIPRLRRVSLFVFMAGHEVGRILTTSVFDGVFCSVNERILIFVVPAAYQCRQ